MNTPVKKWRMPLSVEEIQKSINGNPKAVTESDKYGKSLWVEVTEWSDGGISASNYNAETKQSFKIGNNGKIKDMANTNAGGSQDQKQKETADFNFDL